MDLEKTAKRYAKFVASKITSGDSCTCYGEPQAFLALPNGRTIEVTREEYGLPESERFFSLRLHSTNAEFDEGYFYSTCGVIETLATSSICYSELEKLILNLLAVNEGLIIRTNERRKLHVLAN